eukprot:gb/GEZN01012229.1/.p1 GENE.gb/GEZN01012229.1/~~gb/GEZN01012229.1/.p1  ORF type:complete len:342 (-),score=52.35 gb/GEZN01012229.1/:48-1073(-)
MSEAPLPKKAKSKQTTQCIRIHEFGSPDAMKWDEKVELPDLKETDLLVKIQAAGVNFIDTYHRSGLDGYKLPLPLCLGREGAGVIMEVGSKVANFKPGDHVVFFVQGTYSALAIVPAAAAVAIPDSTDAIQAAAVFLQGLTAHYLLTSSYPLKQGEWALIHAGAGGCGGLMIQIAKLKGARVITTVSTESKAIIAKETGADFIINYSKQHFHQEVMRITENKGVHVVYDGVGKSTFEKSALCLRPRGYLVLFGNASGPVPPIDPLKLTEWGSIFMTRPTLKDYISDPAEKAARVKDLFEWMEAGKLKVRIAKTFPLEKAAEAHRLLESRGALGKIVLVNKA